MGGNVQLEMVDTIRGDDKYSNPRAVEIGSSVINLTSRNYAKSRVVGACEVEPDSLELLKQEGIEVVLPPEPTIKDVHLASLREALPDTVRISPSTQFFASIGAQAYQLVLVESAKFIDRQLRKVDEGGKIVPADLVTDGLTSIYGLGDKQDEGILPPLEAMMAIEVIKKVLDNNGADCQIVHVAGPDMIRYTKLDEVMRPVENIARAVLNDLGINMPITVDYIVPCMKTILSSAGFYSGLTENIRSQYDILAARQKETSLL
jgi:hypothetical protein